MKRGIDTSQEHTPQRDMRPYYSSSRRKARKSFASAPGEDDLASVISQVNEIVADGQEAEKKAWRLTLERNKIERKMKDLSCYHGAQISALITRIEELSHQSKNQNDHLSDTSRNLSVDTISLKGNGDRAYSIDVNYLQQQIARNMTEIERLEKELETMNDTSQSHISQLKARVMTQEATIRDLRRGINEDQDVLKESNTIIEHLEAQLLDAKNRVEAMTELEKGLLVKDEEIMQLKTLKDEQRIHIHSLNQLLNSSRNNASRVAELEEEVVAKDNKIDEYQITINELNEELSNANEKELEISQLEKDITSRDRKIEEYRATVSELKHEISDASSKDLLIAELKNEISSRDRTIEAYKATIDEMNEELLDIGERNQVIGELEDEIDTKNKRMEEYQAVIKNLREDLSTANENEKVIAELEKEISTAKNNALLIAELEEEISVKDSEVKECQAMINQLRQNLASASEKDLLITELEDEIASRISHAEEFQKAIKLNEYQMEQIIKSHESHDKIRNEKGEALRKKIEEYADKLEDAAQHIKYLESQMDSQNVAMATANSRSVQLQDQIKEKEKEVAHLKHTITENNQAQSDIDRMQSNFNMKMEDINKKLYLKDREISDYQCTTAKQNKEIEELKLTYNGIMSKLHSTAQELKESWDTIALLKQENEDAIDANTRVEQRLERIGKLEKTVRIITEQLQIASNERKATEGEYSAMSERFSKATQRAERAELDLEEDRKSTRHQLEKLEMENKKLSAKVDQLKDNCSAEHSRWKETDTSLKETKNKLARMTSEYKRLEETLILLQKYSKDALEK